jgi:selenocysteine lyase/cysteine desulfurase
VIKRPRSDLPGRDPKFFDCASLAEVPASIASEAVSRRHNNWDELVRSARDTVARVLAPVNDDSYPDGLEPEGHFTLFNNTTSALGRVLSRIDRDYVGGDSTLLTTDLEYAGCLAAIDDTWSGPVMIAQVASALATDPSDPAGQLHRAITRSFNVAKPGVVFVSHLLRTTGQELQLETLRYLREANPRVIIVLDGSQAVGNVVIKLELLQYVDFYIGSGHKWLGGMPSSGFVWRREASRWEIADPAQSLSYPGYLGGTGNAAAWLSLIRSVDDMIQNRPLARLTYLHKYDRALGGAFCNAVSKARGINIVTPRGPDGKPPSGLVTVALPHESGAALRDGLRDGKYRATPLVHEPVKWLPDNARMREAKSERFVIACDRDWPRVRKAEPTTSARPSKASSEFRFCFHYWHTEDDVLALARVVLDAHRAATTPARRRGSKRGESARANAAG